MNAAVAAVTNDENTGMTIVPDGDWSHIKLGRTKWAMVRVGGDTIRRVDSALGNIEFEIQRLTNNGEFEE